MTVLICWVLEHRNPPSPDISPWALCHIKRNNTTMTHLMDIPSPFTCLVLGNVLHLKPTCHSDLGISWLLLQSRLYSFSWLICPVKYPLNFKLVQIRSWMQNVDRNTSMGLVFLSTLARWYSEHHLQLQENKVSAQRHCKRAKFGDQRQHISYCLQESFKLEFLGMLAMLPETAKIASKWIGKLCPRNSLLFAEGGSGVAKHRLSVTPGKVIYGR